jgi:hypothetical protein
LLALNDLLEFIDPDPKEGPILTVFSQTLEAFRMALRSMVWVEDS